MREDQSRWVGIPSSFVEISLKIHASVSLHMHKDCRVSQLNLPALELTQAHIVRLFFVLFSHSLDCISCSHKEMCDTPVGTNRWSPTKIEMFRRSWCNGGRGDIVTYKLEFNVYLSVKTSIFKLFEMHKHGKIANSASLETYYSTGYRLFVCSSAKSF